MGIHRFMEFELDEDQRELRLRGSELSLQPRVLDLLIYLIRHRQRTVGKDELLEALWPGVVVTEASLQRAVSLARSALKQGGAEEAIRTYSRQGYRFCAPLEDRTPVAAVAADNAASGAAREALAAHDWSSALAGFQTADRQSALSGAELEQWAYAALCAGRSSEAVAPLERAVAAYGATGERIGAARAALLLAQVQFERREVAVAGGWLTRAATLLANEAGCREHGFHAWLVSRMALAEGELGKAWDSAERTLALGRELGDPDLEALGLAYRGLAALSLGRTDEGVADQDEAAVAVLGGAITPLLGGMIYCAVIWGCRNRGDWRRAAQWTEQFSRWCADSGLATFPGQCRLHRAEVLSIGGQLSVAEREAREACEMLAVSQPWAEGEAYRILGEIRLARGDLDGAEQAFRQTYALGWDPQPGYALLQLARGEAEAAWQGLERALDEPGWASRQRYGLLLAHYVIAAAEAGEPERARQALEELDARAEMRSAPAMSAMLARAWAEVAMMEGHAHEAVASLRRALELWQAVGSPFNVATLRLRLAQWLAHQGDKPGAELELSAAELLFGKLEVAAMDERCATLRRQLALPPRLIS